MNETILYVGLDVDDIQYHGSAVDQHTGAIIEGAARLWSPPNGLISMRYSACEYEDVSPRSQPTRGSIRS